MEFDLKKTKSTSRFPLRGLLLLSTDGKRFIHTKGTLAEISVVEVQKPPEEKTCSQTRNFFDKQKEDEFLSHCAQEYDNTPVGFSAEKSRAMKEWKGTEYMSKVKTTWFLERWFQMQRGDEFKLSPEAVESLQKMMGKLAFNDRENLQKDISIFLSEFGSHVSHGPYIVGGRLIEKVSISDCKELDKGELWDHIEAEFSNMDPEDVDILCAVRIKTENTEDELVEITRQVEMFGGDDQASDLQQWKDSLQNSNLVLSGVRSSDILQPVWDIVNTQENLLGESCKALSSLMKETWYRDVGIRKEESYMQKNLEILNILHINKATYSLFEMTDLREADLKESNSKEDVMWTFVRSIGSLDFRVRKFRSHQPALEEDSGDAGLVENTKAKKRGVDSSVSAMDVTFAIVHRSDSFLRQELLWKMVECRLAVPILLPGLETKEIIEFQLWGLRKIYKSWKSKVTNVISSDKSIVSHPLPIVSFLRFGTLPYSKSKLINKIIGKLQGNNDHPCFVDKEEEPPCAIGSKGTLEAAWFLPEGRSNDADLSKLRDAVALFNLRGNALDFPIQRQFAWKASDVVVALIGEEITRDLLHEIFDNAKGMTNHALCILPSKSSQCTYVSMEGLNNVTTLHSTSFLAAVGQDICKQLNQVLWASQKESERKTKFKTIESLTSLCNDLNIQIDEQKPQCQQGKQLAEKVKENISVSAEEYKATHLPLQGTLWKEWASLDSKWSKGYGHQRFDTIEHYHDHLKQEMLNIRTQQLSKPPSNDIVTFVNALRQPRECRQYFIAWLNFFLNCLSFTTLGPLYKQLLEIYNSRRETNDDIFKLKTKSHLSDCDEAHLELLKRDAELVCNAQETSTEIDSLSLGVEHYIRELGQYYEAYEDLKGMVETNVETPVNVAMFPEIAADLLIDGQPLEILDGDVGRVPIKWVKAVLKAVNDKLGGDVMVRTISVLGIQSSGKSTLLNSMFGVKFAVGAGRCTRGVFIQLVKVHESLAEELSCDYLIVIDTEGLRAPGKSFHHDFRHDNELATFALCLADFTLINIAGQTVGKDMTDVLQIAAHAAIRMKSVHIKSSCCIIQQFVADPAAVEKNEASMLSILKLLDDATAAAAKDEGCGPSYTRFSDVFNLKRNEDLQYIPSLWQGSMAPPNHRYSETIKRLKRFILEDLKKHSRRSFEQFAERVLHVWNAVKEENFIFSFKNCEIALRYKTFHHVYGKWISEMRQTVIESESDAKQRLKTAPGEQLHEVKEKLRNDIKDVIKRECKRIQDQIVLYLKEQITDNDDQLHKFEDEFLKDLDLTEKNFTLDASKTLDRIVSDIAQLNEMDILLPKCRNELREKARTHAVGMRRTYVKETPFDELGCVEQINTVFEELWEGWIRPICKRHPMKGVTEEDVRKEFDEYLDCQRERKDLSRGLKKRLGISQNRCQVKADKLSCGNQTELVKKLIIKPLHDLEEDIGKELAFDPMIIRKLVDSAIDIVNEDYTGVTLTQEDKVDGLLEVCEQAVPIILEGRRIYHTKYSLEAFLIQEKENLREDFRSLCVETFQNQRAVESFTNVLNEKVVDVVRNDLGFKIYETVRECCPYFNSKFAMFGYLLEDLAKKEEFNSYYKFLFELEEFIEEWSLHNIAEVCVAENREGKSLIENIVDMKIADIREQLLLCITSTTKNANALEGDRAAGKEMDGEFDQTLISWINDFCKELRKNRSTLSLPADDVNNLRYFKVNDMSLFSSQVREHVEKQLVQTVFGTLNLPQVGNVKAAESMLLTLPTKPHKEIKGHVSGCTEQCPICHVPCDNMTVQHEKHRAELHYPEGLIGCATARDDCLACTICTSSVATDEPYWDGEKRRKYCDYQKDFPTWVIQPIQNDSPLKYWKWVMQRFNKDLAQLYGYQEAKLPEGWLCITKQEAIEDLREAYATKRKT